MGESGGRVREKERKESDGEGDDDERLFGDYGWLVHSLVACLCCGGNLISWGIVLVFVFLFLKNEGKERAWKGRERQVQKEVWKLEGNKRLPNGEGWRSGLAVAGT